MALKMMDAVAAKSVFEIRWKKTARLSFLKAAQIDRAITRQRKRARAAFDQGFAHGVARIFGNVI